MNKRVIFIAFLLFLLTAGLMAARVYYGGHTIQREYGHQLWRVTTIIELDGRGKRAKVRLTLPHDTPRQTIYNEIGDSGDMAFYTRERPVTGNRVGFWLSELLDGSRTIKYTFSVQSKAVRMVLPPTMKLPKDAKAFYGEEFEPWLKPSRYIQSRNSAVRSLASKMTGKDKDLLRVNRKLYDFVRDQVKYRSEIGSKDALDTLDQLTADCGGQARLFVALSRALKIPSRIVGGIIMADEIKQTTHVWVENYLNGRWIPFDVVNGHYAYIPANYLELYRGDYALIKHVGLTNLKYFFIIQPERIPPIDQPWSLYVLPLHFQDLVQTLLLIPVGTLVVSFMRIVVGVTTFGTFTPVLIALALSEIGLWQGLIVLGAIVLFGWIFRYVLDHLKILIIPRLSIIITFVIISVISLMMVGLYTEKLNMLYISLFPIIIITWTIERFSVVQIEDNLVAAMKGLLGTGIVAMLTFYVMALPVVRPFLFSFPEILFSIIGLQLLLGRYTWVRLFDLWRFKDFLRMKKS